MKYFYLYCLMFLMTSGLMAQSVVIVGVLKANHSKLPITNAIVQFEGSSRRTISNVNGSFEIGCKIDAFYLLLLSATGFLDKRIPIEISNENIDLGIIHLDRDFSTEKRENLITLTEIELSDEEDIVASTGMLQATRDIYLSRAAFDFSQVFYKVRGYDSEHGLVLINGIRMNKLLDGRPQWNNWGGLNDITKNQEFSYGLQASDYAFGGLLGVTNINTRPSMLRAGTKLSTSVSNRSYAGRLMLTHVTSKGEKGLSYAVSASRRWSKKGFIDGTIYDAYSIFASLEYNYNKTNSVHFTAILAANRKGQFAAITEEVFKLQGREYNPYWGLQNNAIRNSKERKIMEPLLMFNQYHFTKKLRWHTAIAYQFGIRTKSRLGYYNAPNPDPSYYRNLPSFYLNSPIGANFKNAALAKEGFSKNHQLNWKNIYKANANNIENAAYILYDDSVEEFVYSLNSTANLKLNKILEIDLGLSYKNQHSKNYAKIKDLLGAKGHKDVDPFTNTINDINGNREKLENEKFNYNYQLLASNTVGFLQLKGIWKTWDAFISAKFTNSSFKRKGIFRNERYPKSSQGGSRGLKFLNYGIKTGATFKISARHWITSNGAYFFNPPNLKNTFINPRENNTIVPDIKNEKISSVDISYNIRLPYLNGRVTGFYTRFLNTTDINFFFVDSGLGSHFVQEVKSELDKLHMGIEFGLKYQVSSSVMISMAGSVGKYLFASDPSISISFVPEQTPELGEEDTNMAVGNLRLGTARIKDLKLSQGPQKVFALGVNYRDPKYWWVGITANYLTNNYANISTIIRTPSFYLDPDTGLSFSDVTQEKVAKLLKQYPLESTYLLNLTVGKSWRINGKYLSAFVSVNNVFDSVFKSGGYEQSRNGNYSQLASDNLSGSPSFASKFWFGYGRTYFMNIAVSF